MDSNGLQQELDRLRGLKNKQREAELQELLSDDFARKVCYAALDPNIRYHINTLPELPPATLNWCFGDSTLPLLAKLAARELTGNAARAALREEMSRMSDDSRELLQRIIKKDLRCGAGPKTFNKIIPGFVPVFEMQTCHGYEAKRVRSWPVAGEIKYDGTRVACVWEDGVMSIVSRNGLPMPGFEAFGANLQEMLQPLGLPAMVLDGEMDSDEGFYETVGGARRKNGQGEFILRLFDAIPLEAFKQGTSALPWHKRSKVVEALVTWLSDPSVRLSQREELHSDAEVEAMYARARAEGQEGIIVKQIDAPYECKRGYHWMKIKPKATVDVPVTGIQEGTGKYQGQMGKVVCDLEGVEVRVGTGWSDEQRVVMWQNAHDYYGRVMEVEYAEKTPDGSLRHPRFVRWRQDKHPEDGPGV